MSLFKKKKEYNDHSICKYRFEEGSFYTYNNQDGSEGICMVRKRLPYVHSSKGYCIEYEDMSGKIYTGELYLRYVSFGDKNQLNECEAVCRDGDVTRYIQSWKKIDTSIAIRLFHEYREKIKEDNMNNFEPGRQYKYVDTDGKIKFGTVCWVDHNTNSIVFINDSVLGGNLFMNSIGSECASVSINGKSIVICSESKICETEVRDILNENHTVNKSQKNSSPYIYDFMQLYDALKDGKIIEREDGMMCWFNTYKQLMGFINNRKTIREINLTAELIDGKYKILDTTMANNIISNRGAEL